MAHTNSTTNYSLPQFVPTDKPAWLTDINGAFSDIDTAIHTAQTKADSAYSDAGTAQADATSALTNAAAADAKGSGALASIEVAFDPTTVYSVGAKVIYNSLLYRCTVAVITPGPWTGSDNWERITVDNLITTTDSKIGSLTSLSTTDKTSLVNAVNEVNGAMIAKIPSSSVLKANFTANSNPAYGTTLTDTINTTKGIYLAVFSLPVMSITSNFGVQLTGTNFTLYGGYYPSLTPQGTCAWIVNVTSATGTLYVRSADGQACNFSYNERGGLNVFKLIDT